MDFINNSFGAGKVLKAIEEAGIKKAPQSMVVNEEGFIDPLSHIQWINFMAAPMIKKIEELTANDLDNYLVWSYVDSGEGSDVWVSPVTHLPVANLNGQLVVAEVHLACGLLLTGILGNMDVENTILTKHFLMLSLLKGDKWFALARYHDYDYATSGPDALSGFLELSLGEIYPIKYQINPDVLSSTHVLRGEITIEPEQRLTRAQIIALAISD